MATTAIRVASLDEAIEQQMEGLGVREAEEAVRRVLRLYGEDEVRAWAADLFMEVAHWRSLMVEGRLRRASERDFRARPDEPGVVRRYLTSVVRVPVYEKGTIVDFETCERGAMAEAQHEAVIRYRAGQIRGIQVGIEMHERDLWLMRKHKVSCLNELPVDVLAVALERAA